MRKILGLVAVVALTQTGCIIVSDGDPQPTPNPSEIEAGCWAIGVTDFSSSGLPGQNDFGATQATGIPDTQDWDDPQCVDSPQAWSPEYENAGHEYIDLIYAVGLRVDRIRSYENFGPGATLEMTLINTEQPGVPSATIPVPSELQGPGQPCSVLALDIDSENGGEYTIERYDKVAIDLDTAMVNGFNEIDAVQLVGLYDTDFGSLPGSCEPL